MDQSDGESAARGRGGDSCRRARGRGVFTSPKCPRFGNHSAAQIFAIAFVLVKKSELFLDLDETFRIAEREKCND